ncbi:MAG: hypothetical protein PHS31_00560 [Victivallaceae bacterium]|nr:hypothetical protein [Victivallaceae bacterium]MDD4180713.1 hypothetical protein [Victivallaceae bacterium]
MNCFTIILFCVLSAMCALGDNVAEAKRFFDEYEALSKTKGVFSIQSIRKNDWRNVKTPLETAAALDPENLCYRRELIVFELTRVHDHRVNWRGKLDVFHGFLKGIKEFYKKYPAYSHSGEPIFANVRKSSIISLSFMPVERASDFERAELSRIFTELRKLHDHERRQADFYRELDLSNGINSVRELSIYRAWISDGLRFFWYYDTAEMMSNTYRQGLEFYRAMRDFLDKHPEARRQKLEIFNLMPYDLHEDRDRWHYTETVAEFKKIFTDFDEITRLVKEIDYEPLTVRYYNWIAVGEFINSDHSEKALKNAVFRFYDNLEKYTSSKNGDLSCFLSVAIYIIPKYGDRRTPYTVLRNIRGEYELMKANKDTFELYLADIKRGVRVIDFERLKYFVSELSSSALVAICDNTVHSYFNQIFFQLRNSNSSSEGRKLLDDLNSAWNIRELPFTNRICYAATELDGEYFLLLSDSSGMLQLTKINVEKMVLEDLPAPGIKVRKFQPNLPGSGGTISMSAFGGYLIFGGRNSVLLYNITTQKWNHVEELPGHDVASATIIHDRCYVLLGGRTQAIGSNEILSMSSFALDGSKRRLHFSSRRIDKLNQLDSLPQGKFSDLIELPDGKLLFAVSVRDMPTRVYSFEPQTERFEEIREFRDINIFSLRDQGDFILGNCRRFGERFFKIDKATLEIEYFLTQHKGDTRWAKGNKVKQIKGEWELKAPFLLADGFLLSASSWSCPLVLNLEKPKDSPLLMVPAGINLFRLKEKTYLFISQKQISITELK